MPRTGNILVHSLEFQVTTLKEIIHTHSRHIQKSVIAGTVTVKEVITQGSLQKEIEVQRGGRVLKLTGRFSGISNWTDDYSVVVAGFNDKPLRLKKS